MRKILFLGYNSKKTKLISFLKKKNIVKQFGQKKLSLQKAKQYDLILSFGYNKIIKQNILKKLRRPPINLHISYLPYNKGAHPNFWSFFENSPNGVSIHEIDKGIDTGRIILRKKINFKLKKNLTFKHTYDKLNLEIENLFKKNSKKILEGNYSYIKNFTKGSFHSKKDLPKDLFSWKISIKKYLNS